MSRSEALIEAIEEFGINTIFYLPCSTMKEVINHFEFKKNVELVPINREEEGIGLITGMYMSGLKPLLLIQDSGLGNSYNAIVSLLQLYHIAVPIVVTMRGYFMEISSPNSIWSSNTSAINRTLNLKEYILDDTLEIDFWKNRIIGAFSHLSIIHNPIIIQINLVESRKKDV